MNKKALKFNVALGLVFASVSSPALGQSETALGLDGLIVPHLKEVSAQANLSHSYIGGWEFFVGGGGASFDCNNDHKPDIALAGGAGVANLFINQSSVGGDLAFQSVEWNLDQYSQYLTNVLGIYSLDIDNDGLEDLVLLRLGENLVLRGTGNCEFERANELWNIDGGNDWTTSFAATWERDETYPTLAFGNYVDRAAEGAPWGTCADNVLMRPSGGDAPNYGNAHTLSPGYCTLSMLFSDWNRSGLPALRVTNDRQYYRGGEEQLWRIDPQMPPRLYTRADGWEHLKIWGMGIASADLNADGVPEYALTSMGDTKLQVLENPFDTSSPKYVDIAYERGVTAHQPYHGGQKLPSTGWHAEFADFNNDGREDLFIAKGNVEAMPDFAAFDPDNLLLQAVDQRFVEAGLDAGVAQNTKGRGAIIDDFNRDGMLDLLVINRGANASLFQNLGWQTDWGHRPMGNWVDLTLRDKGANPHGIGTRILVKAATNTISKTLSVGGGHASGSRPNALIGVGQSDRVTVRVQWADGTWSHDFRVLANQHVVLDRAKTDPIYYLIAD